MGRLEKEDLTSLGSSSQNQIKPSLLPQHSGQNPRSFTVETPAQCGHTALLRQRMGLHLARRTKRQRRGGNIPKRFLDSKRGKRWNEKKIPPDEHSSLSLRTLPFLSAIQNQSSHISLPCINNFFIMPCSLQGVFTNIISCDSFSFPFHFTSLPLPE